MARLVTEGAELGGGYIFPNSVFVQAGAAVTTTNPRTGTYAFVCAADGDTVIGPTTATLDVVNYSRHYMRFSSVAPANAVYIVRPWDGTAGYQFGIRLETNGTLTLRDAVGTQIGSASSALSANTYYCIELEWMVPTGGGSTSGTLGMYLDNILIARSTACNAGSNVKTEVDAGRQSGTATLTITIDDIAVNDSTGTSQNQRPGPGKVWLLKPTADVTINSDWQAPQTTGADTTNIFDAIDNLPPAGVAHSDTDANNLKYIFETTSGTTINYVASLQTINAVVPSSEKITLIQAICNTGSSSATDTNGGLQLTSNPSEAAETSFVFDNGVAGTFPTNWRTTRGGVTYAPTINRGSATQVTIGKRTATTRVAMVDFLGAIVESGPASLVYVPRIQRNTLLRL